MGQNKLQRFAEIKTFPNVLEYPEGMQGEWNKFFSNSNPVVLELACGKGEYAVGLGRLHSEKNFIGVDIKGNRMWVGAKTALEEGLRNVAFLRTQIERIGEFFGEKEVAEIWITFPDPQLRAGKAKKRLTHPRFLRLYQTMMGHSGVVNLKTDSPDLYHFTREVISLYNLTLLEDLDNVHGQANLKPDLKIETHYEKLDIARSQRVHYLRFQLNQQLPVELDEQLKQLMFEAAAC